MRKFVFLLCFLCACGVTPVPNSDPAATAANTVDGKIEQGGRTASLWSLHQLNKLNSSLTAGTAKALKSGCQLGADYLASKGAQETAEAINTYLIGILLKDLNPMVAAGIDTAAVILDDVLQVPAGNLLTTAELNALAAFLKGLAEGCDDFSAGKEMPPAIYAVTKSAQPRKWLKKAEQ